MPEKRIFKHSEIKEICKDQKMFEASRDEILEAISSGRVKMGE